MRICFFAAVTTCCSFGIASKGKRKIEVGKQNKELSECFLHDPARSLRSDFAHKAVVALIDRVLRQLAP